jgi:hypothetical protein
MTDARAKTMTEAEWFGSTDPWSMLQFLRGRSSDRKLRLFAVACCRRIWHFFADEVCKQTVEVGERFADGLASRNDRKAARAVAQAYAYAEVSAGREQHRDWASAALATVETPARSAALSAFLSAARTPANSCERDPLLFQEKRNLEQVEQCRLLRDVFNPFRPVSLDPVWLAWNDGTVPKMAQAIYHERAFDRLPILADALEDAGCDNADVLAHCRGEGEHVRGCWVVDLLLGRA